MAHCSFIILSEYCSTLKLNLHSDQPIIYLIITD
jgi:hypothetical protein